MLGRFGRDAGSLLGVEIAPPFIRLVRLARHQGRYRLQAWALEPLPATAMHNGWIADPEQVGAALLQAVRRAGGAVRRLAIALPGALVIEKLLTMAVDLDDQAIARRLPLEAAQFIPFALEDAAVDFQVVDRDPDDRQRQRVVVAACDLALLESLEASLEFAGVRAGVVEPDGHALQRALQVNGDSDVLLLQVEADTLVFHQWGATLLPLRHEVPRGQQADLLPLLVRAVDSYLLANPQGALPGRLLLSGAGAAQMHLPLQLQEHLGMEVGHANPFKHLQLAANPLPQSLMAQAPYLVVACGLAMREGGRCLI